MFDNTCKNLNKTFEEVDSKSIDITSAKYIDILSDISNQLKSLKDSLNTLSSTCSENKYFEMKNHIVQHEMKFNKLRGEHETAKKEFQLRYFTSTSEYQEKYENSYYESNVSNNQYSSQKTPTNVISQKSGLRNRNRFMQKTPVTEKLNNRPRCSIIKKKHYQNNENEQQEFEDELLNFRANDKKTVETCDKSTFTINDMATQTDQPFVPNHQFNLMKSKITNVNLNGQTESDGKKLLLEAYLRNNSERHLIHIENSIMESSQSSNSGLLTSTRVNKKRKSLTTIDTR